MILINLKFDNNPFYKPQHIMTEKSDYLIIKHFSVLILLIYTLPICSQNKVYDARVDKLMQEYKYKETTYLIENLFKKKIEIDFNTQLFYFNNISIAHYKSGDIDSAKYYALKSLNILSKSSDSLMIFGAWKAAAYVYNDEGKFDSALFYTKHMLTYSKRVKNDLLYRNSLLSMASILFQNKKHAEALNYYKEINIYNQRLKDTSAYGISHYNLGLTYLSLNQFDSCLFHLNKAVIIAKKNKHLDLLTNVYGAIADCYISLKNRKEWKKYMMLANGLAEQLNNQLFVAMGNTNLLIDAIKYKNYTEAIIYGEKTLKILKTNPYPILQITVDSMMYIACKSKNRNSEALNYLESYINLKTKILNEKEKQQINELIVQYEVEKKDLIIENQKLKIIRNQRNQLIFILLSIILLLIIFWQILHYYKNRAFRKKIFLKEKNIELQMKEIRQWMEGKHIRSVEQTKNTSETFDKETNQISLKQEITPKDKLYDELRELIEKYKLYLDPEINLQAIIQKLGTNKKYLYEAISQNTNNNFRTIINRYRVDEAKRIIELKIKNKEPLIISELYSLVGFNSAVSFYRAFRQVIGLTPKEYSFEVKREYQNN